jgi:hypothetical protein
MKQQTPFEQRWLQGKAALQFTMVEPPRFPYLCERAQQLAGLCEQSLQRVRDKPDEIAVNLALLDIQEHFFAAYESAPRAHQVASDARKRRGAQHTCLVAVYTSYLDELRQLRRQVNPPLLRKPLPQPRQPAPAQTPPAVEQAPAPAFQGIYLGEDLGRARVP